MRGNPKIYGKKYLPSSILPARASALNPANTTLWTAPILAQANMEAIATGEVGR